MPTSQQTAYEPWDPTVTYVIGHQRPDTDAIGSALGYAYFLTATGMKNVVAARCGQIGPQTRYALERFGLAPPGLLTAVAPTFGHVARPQEVVAPDAPLSRAMAWLAAGDSIVPVVDAEGRPLGAVTPLAFARALSATLPNKATLGQSCGEVMEQLPIFPSKERLSDHRGVLLRSAADEFLVTDGEGKYAGVATQRRILDPPRAKLILVDHNELGQAVTGANEAEIMAVLDHHRLGNPPTAQPIPFVVEPVGSTCTLVAEEFAARELEPPPGLAGMMLSGILSDTLVFRSPTTTDRDRKMAAGLARLARVEIAEYGHDLLRASPGLGGRAAGEILDADRKSYEIGGRRISIAQVEVAGFEQLPERYEELRAALDERRQREALDLICLMVTDIVTGRSRLLCRGEPPLLTALPYSHIAADEWDLGDVISRKKQLVPTLSAVLEDRL